MTPPLIVADEPTGNLDSKTGTAVFEMFMNLVNQEHKTMIMVTHDKELAAQVPRVIEILDGRISRDINGNGYLPN